MPRFPYPPSVNTDLRDLFRKDREGRTARDLGRSSITRGDGSLDLYETDDGPVTHRYGDLPGGSFGVGITHRGAFANVSDLIGGVQDKNTAQDGRLGSAEGRLDGHDGRLDGHASRLGTAEGRLDSHAGRIGATETKNAAQDGRLDDHASRIGAVEGSSGSLGTRISEAESRLDSHASRIGATENKNTAQDGRLDSHVSRIGALENRATAIENEIDHIKNWLQANTPYPSTIHSDSRYFLQYGQLPP